ncbi:MAG: TonB-dependent receptor [Gammaproteobacteria bacterium]|nr:TonB-dependent receptor [Gammaproteobacteria bacterium]
MPGSLGPKPRCSGSPLTDLTLGTNFSFTPSEYTEDFLIKDPASIDTPGSLFPSFEGQVKNINGNQLLQVPEGKLTGWGGYRFGLNDGSSIELFGTYSWIDEVYYSPFEDDDEKAESYDRVDLRATWTSTDRRWEVSAYVNNVFDDVGVLQILSEGEDEFFRRSAGTTLPRMYGIELTFMSRP